ncbi:MAG: cobalt-precorrin-6A reductase, partial [Rhodospirillales bacterium]|nr:cobalt-precorrin-6A reductase [Rhodospirillales bacterium]
MPKHVLILGGTFEAARLAREAAAAFGDAARLTVSFAGRVKDLPDLPGGSRVGGFGGAKGLGDYLKAEHIDLVVDATHPFAARISANAYDACTRTGVPRLMLVRPPWEKKGGDRWLEMESPEAAAAALPRIARRVFLTLGSGGLNAFSAIPGIWILARVIELPDPAPAGLTLITGRPPYTVADERALMEEHRIDTLVAKQSGGGATEAKIQAARELGVRVVLIERP